MNYNISLNLKFEIINKDNVNTPETNYATC